MGLLTPIAELRVILRLYMDKIVAYSTANQLTSACKICIISAIQLNTKFAKSSRS